MSEFKIDVDSFYWIDSDDANTGDLCLHGHVRVQIGSYQSEDYGTVSASALYLLKTLSRNHIPESEIQDIISGKGRISADTAMRLSAFFGTTSQFWLNLQNRYDLDIHEAERRREL